MISILVCSVSHVFLEQLKVNIAQRIGVEYELLVHDNRTVNKGICEVYNLLAEKAKFDFLCFVHEDVLFTTQNWGVIFLKLFGENEKLGVFGVAGSKYKSSNFSGWYTGIKELDCANILHRFGDKDEKIYLRPENGSLLEDVVCLDGVFICCRKKVWEQVKFDEVNLKGFHFYDIDFTLRAAKLCSVGVTYLIDLIHITKQGGDFGNKWVETAITYHQKHQHDLPFAKVYNSSDHFDIQIAKMFLDVLKNYKISWKNKFKWVMSQELHRYVSLYYSIVKFMVYKPLHLIYLHKLFKSK